MKTIKQDGRPRWTVDLSLIAVCNYLGCTIQELEEKLTNDFRIMKFGYSPLFLDSKFFQDMHAQYTELILSMNGEIESNMNQFIPILEAAAHAASYEINLGDLVNIGLPIVIIGTEWLIDEADLEAIITIANEISFKHNNPKKQSGDKLISFAKAMYLLKCGPITLDILLRTGLLRMRSHKGNVVFYKSDVMNFIREDHGK